MNNIIKKTIVFAMAVIFALSAAGCSGNNRDVPDEPVNTVTGFMDDEVVGEGEKRFILTITDKDGDEISITVNTDETTVGTALLKAGVITGEAGPYGMYIKTVNGITADFDKDKTYWAFYINGEYAMTGIDMTDIEKGRIYGLKVEK